MMGGLASLVFLEEAEQTLGGKKGLAWGGGGGWYHC